jgi:hypothetical protein
MGFMNVLFIEIFIITLLTKLFYPHISINYCSLLIFKLGGHKTFFDWIHRAYDSCREGYMKIGLIGWLLTGSCQSEMNAPNSHERFSVYNVCRGHRLRKPVGPLILI